MMISMSHFCHCVAFSDYSAFVELDFLQRPDLQFLAAFAIVHLLSSNLFPELIVFCVDYGILCKIIFL